MSCGVRGGEVRSLPCLASARRSCLQSFLPLLLEPGVGGMSPKASWSDPKASGLTKGDGDETCEAGGGG